ncbi:hypothetical protein [Leptospira sp. GIMC2001]|uniref:hypothetical protein n=1 Tax=Leptospira sp. GIMC2001 TaxID=1513297 RepID=UPI0023495CC5|nr:hypothetical protein [Leptospira sp. GIMC2001]WCL51295.1 hypothetical protein O4O04_03975 [Leptospira sp. GIMC2001]
MANLIEKYLTLKNRYRNYDTKHALKRMQAFRLAVQELSNKGYQVALELLGSINFGIVEDCSDVDSILLHYCELHKDEGSCPDDCPNLVFEKNEIVKLVNRRLEDENIKVDFLDNINLKFVDNSLRKGFIIDNEALYRLLFYRNLGRPVNRPLFIPYCEQLEDNPEFIKEILPWASEALTGYLNTNQHRLSFNKYNERILSRGMLLPKELEMELKKYLEGDIES